MCPSGAAIWGVRNAVHSTWPDASKQSDAQRQQHERDRQGQHGKAVGSDDHQAPDHRYHRAAPCRQTLANPRPDFAATFERVTRRYRDCGRFARGYVARKLRRDPVHQDVLALAADEAFGDVVDIGCGRGQLAVALLEAGLARSVLGLDRNAGHLRQACRAATGLRSPRHGGI